MTRDPEPSPMESPWQNEQPLARTVASDPEADAHLREHARELVDILERDAAHKPGPDCAPSRNASPSGCARTSGE